MCIQFLQNYSPEFELQIAIGLFRRLLLIITELCFAWQQLVYLSGICDQLSKMFDGGYKSQYMCSQREKFARYQI